MQNSLPSPHSVTTQCVRCGREIVTHSVEMYRFRFPAERVCTPCREAQRGEEDQKRADMLLSIASIPDQYRHCTFSNYKPELGNRTALKLASDWSREFRQGRRPRRGLLLEGPPGCGKTHLAVAIITEAIYGQFARCLFLNVPEWLNRMKEAFVGDDAGRAPSPRGFDLVVLDDLGTEHSSEWSRDQIYSLINHRETNGLPTLVTTNLKADELRRRLGNATVSRLDRLCKPVVIDARSDFRLRLADKADEQ